MINFVLNLLWGVKDQEVHVNVYIGPRAQSKEKPLLGHVKNPLRHGCSQGQREQPATGSDASDHSTEQESTKAKKDNGKNGNV